MLLVYKGISLQLLRAVVTDDPSAWFELVIPKHSPITAAFLEETLFMWVFP